ncbi:MAG: KTSC domain-containing protein [Rhizomicrobium sp.]
MPSSVIRTFSYDAAKRRLRVVFTTGRRYEYHNVPAEVFEAMKAASSKGEYFNAYIRDRFAFTRDA